MPYRRLPTTDLARQRAMKKALQVAGTRTANSAVRPLTIANLEVFSQKFDQILKQINTDKKIRNQRNQELRILETKARMYISHFIMVLNMAIEREEIKSDALYFYGLDAFPGKVPSFVNEEDIVTWGEKIITGEQRRLAKGGNPIYNPSIALVKVVFHEFKDAYINFEHYKETVARASERFIQLRKQCNELIADLWDEIEDHFKDLQPKHKRQKSEEYGVVYIFRRKEKKKLTASDLQADLLFE